MFHFTEDLIPGLSNDCSKIIMDELNYYDLLSLECVSKALSVYINSIMDDKYCQRLFKKDLGSRLLDVKSQRCTIKKWYHSLIWCLVYLSTNPHMYKLVPEDV